MEKFVPVSEEELHSVYGRGGGGRGGGGGGSSGTGSRQSPYPAPAPASPPSTAARVTAALSASQNQPYNNNCDTYCYSALNKSGTSVAGFSDPNNKTCAQHKASIQAAGNYVTKVTDIPKGASAVGVSDTHAFIVVHQADGSYTVGNIGGDKHPDSIMYSDLKAGDVNRIWEKSRVVYGLAK